MFYTYVLLCENDNQAGKFYIGFTHDLSKRMKEHRSGSTKTTKKFTSIKLVYYEVCVNESDGRKREMQLKTGFGRAYIKRRLSDYLKSKSRD